MVLPEFYVWARMVMSIEIGCGGTLLRLIDSSDRIEFYWMVFSSNPERANEAERRRARLSAAGPEQDNCGEKLP